MRLLTVLDLVAGGSGTTDDAQVNGVGGPHGNGGGYGGGGGGGGRDAYNSGSWARLPPASYFGDFPPGGNGTWVWLRAEAVVVPAETAAPVARSGNHIRLGGDPCPVAHAEAYQALASLQNRSPTAAALLAKANAAGLEVILNRNHEDDYDPGLGYGFVSWDPYSAASGRNEDGSCGLKTRARLIHEMNLALVGCEPYGRYQIQLSA